VLNAKLEGNIGANYLLPIVPLGILEVLARTFADVSLLSQSIGFFTLEGVLAFVLLTCSLLLWLPFAPRDSWPRNTLLMFWSLILLWLIANFTSFYHGQYWYWSQASFVLPIVLIMLILKRPSFAAAARAIDFFALLIIITFSIRFIPDVISQVIPWSAWMDVSLGKDRAFRWWELGGNPNIGAPLGVFLVLYAAVRRGKLRYVSLICGLLILLLTLSRGAIFSLLLAIAVMGIYAKRDRLRALSMGHLWTLITVVVLTVSVTILVVVLSDPTLNLRTPVWAYHWELVMSDPPTSLVSGFGETNASWLGEGDLWFASEPHNVLLAAMVRYGIPGVIAVFLVAGATLLVAIDSARQGRMLGIGLWVFVTLFSLTEDQIDWRHFGFLMMMLIIIPLSAAEPPNVEAERSRTKGAFVS